MALPHVFAPLGAPPLLPIPTGYLDDNFNASGVMAVSFCTAAGVNAITLTLTSYSAPISAYTNAQIFSFVAGANSSGAVTLKVGSLAFKKVYVNATGTQATTGDVITGQFYQVVYRSTLDAGAGGFQILYPSFVTATVTGRWVSPEDYGGDPTGVADSAAALTSANAAAALNGFPLVIDGLYKLSSNCAITVPVTFLAPGAFIQNGTLSFAGPILAPSSELFQGSGLVTIAGSAGISAVFPEWWGAVPDGSTDCTAAIAAAIIVAAGKFPVVLGSGSYLTTAVIALGAGTSLFGGGPGVTNIIPSVINQTTFALTSATPVDANVTIKGMTFSPSATGVTAIAFTFCSYTTVRDVHFSGCAFTVVADRGQVHLVEDCLTESSVVAPSGVLKMWSSTDTQTVFAGDQYIYFPTVRNYQVNTNTYFGITTRTDDPCCFFRRCVSGIFDQIQGYHVSSGSPGVGFIVLENDSQGCKFLNCTADAVGYGILLQPGTGVAVAPSYTEITNCDFDFFWSAAIWLNGSVAANVAFVRVSGGYLTAPQNATSLAVYGIYANNVTVSEVQMYNYAATAGVGVKVEHCNIVDVSGCRMITQTSAVDFGVGSNTNVYIHDNWMLANTTNLTGSPAGGFNKFWNNAGLNPPALATPGVPATGVAYTNNTGYNLRIAVTGTVTIIAINAIVTGLTSGIFVVNEGESITITHTAGAWAWMPL